MEHLLPVGRVFGDTWACYSPWLPMWLQALKRLLFQILFAQSGIYLHRADAASQRVGLKSHVRKGLIPQIALAVGQPMHGSVTLALRGDAGWLTQIHGVEALEISPTFLQMLSSSQQPPGSSNKPRSYFNLLVLTIPYLSRNSWPKRLKQPFTQQDHGEAKIVKGIWFPLRKQLGRVICLKHSPTMAPTPPAPLHGEREADK